MPKKNPLKTVESNYLDDLFTRVSNHITTARDNISKTIDTEMVKAYWRSGHDIVEAEQRGEKRANYGREVLKKLSERLQHEFGTGFSVSTLTQMRKFYTIYQPFTQKQKSHALRTKFDTPDFMPNLG